MSLRFILAFALLCLSAVSAWAERRVAFVVGNSNYETVTDLDNPGNDATDLAIALEGLGFEVFRGIDVTRQEFLSMSEAFADAAETSDVVLFFYAGHAFQSGQRNYLVPVDAEIPSAAEIPDQTVTMQQIVAGMERSKGQKLVFLDACRNNPFAENIGDAASDGLAQVGSSANFLYAYATQPDNVAYDGTGRNSFFTEALLNYIYTPGQDISDLMISVRRDVIAATGGRQIPWDNSSLTQQFRFDNSPVTASEETLLWQVAANARDPQLMQLYMERYPQGAHAQDVLAFLESPDTGTLTRNLAPQDQDAQAERLWKLAQRSRMRPLLEFYLEQYPDGAHVAHARRLIDTIPRPEDSTPGGICERLATHPRDATAIVAGVPFRRLQQNAVAAIQACSAAVTQSPDLPHYVGLLARATLAAGDIDRAVTLYGQAADRGVLRSMVSLAQLYESGTGVEKDPARALRLYETAAEGGSLDAMINLAVTLFEGRVVFKDEARAISLLERAAAGGSAKATFNLGVLAQDGLFGAPEAALGYFQRAAQEGEYQGYLAAAILLDEGRGVERDPGGAADMLLRGVAEDSGATLDQLTQAAEQWSRDTLAAVQTRLSAAGYFGAEPDGRPGPEFAAALNLWRNGGFKAEVLGG